jgi:hypothetical protein
MNLHRVVLSGLLVSGVFLCQIHAPAAMGQVRPRVSEVVDDARRITLNGNVHPLARAEFDRGAVADSLPINRILLLLRRSDEQEAALQDALAKLQDKSSPTFHQWLTPEQFGAQFGPADADIQAVTDWLTRQGFTIGKIYSGKTVIEFSGSAAQVQRAFSTAIHNYQVNGKMYSANASDPQIPAALSPVVTGVVSLHNFPRDFYARRFGTLRRGGGKSVVEPLTTFPNPFGPGTFYGLGPGDFAKIYSVPATCGAGTPAPPCNGAGQTIAIVGETNLNVSDVQQFRSIFGLPATFDANNIVYNGEDPGITSKDEEGEALLDTQWSGGAAPGAAIKYVLSASTPASQGVDLSALYIVENNLAGVMSESYGDCETNLGSAGNEFFNSLWEQAAAQGITVVVSSGDAGSAGCDDFNAQQTATQGLAVSGISGTPFNVSVGGTDFDQANSPLLYWNATNDATGTSAKGYIPEIPWNDNCAQIGLTGCGVSAPNGSLNIVAGSGGPSNVYPKPTWQMGVKGMPNDNHRDQPDVSLFASSGFTGTGYLYCQSDLTAPCSAPSGFSGPITFGVIGGTSAAAPSFAGIIALVNQSQTTTQNPAPRQGNANYILYAMARMNGTSCTSSTSEAVGCIFNDVVGGNSFVKSHFGSSVGTNSVACKGGTPDCSVSVASSNGVLVDPTHPTTEAWTATSGYDMATGLGTVNVDNLAAKWGSVSTVKTTTTLSLSPVSGITHGTGENVSVNIIVTPSTGTATGNVSLIATMQGPSGTTTQGLDQFTLDATGKVANATTKSLPGGTNYSVTAHYAGDGTNAPSDSPPIAVTVGKETSQIFVVVPTFDTNGNPTSGNATSFVYGTSFILRTYVTDKNAAVNANGPPSPVCFQENELTCPTGTISLTDNGVSLGQGAFQLNNAGYTRDLSETAATFTGGTHLLSAAYSGDASFGASIGTDTIMVTPAPTLTQDYLTEFYPIVGQPFSIAFITTANVQQGVAPTGTFSFYDNGVPLSTVTGTPQGGSPAILGGISATFSTVGTHNITATYSGDKDYASSTSSSPLKLTAQYLETFSVSANPSTVMYGSPITLTARVVTPHLTPALAGQIVFNLTGATPTTSLSTDGSGNQILTSAVIFTPQSSGSIDVGYGNDPNYTTADTNVSFIVNIPDFNLGPQTGVSVVPVAGQSGSAPITITPVGQTPSTVSLTFAPLVISGYNITLSPQQVNLNGAPVMATLSLTPIGASPASAVRSQTRRLGFFVRGNSNGWPGNCAAFLAIMFLLVLPGRQRKLRQAFGLGVATLFLLLWGCGGGGGGSSGGGGTGGGGGGGTTPQATSITLTTTNAKVGQSVQFQITATITSTSGKPLTGTVNFYNFGAPVNGGIPPTNGQASTGSGWLNNPGLYQITAQYTGDANNLASTSAPLTQVITGTMPVTIQGSTGGDFHFLQATLGLQ